ncbi:MAG: branched-chain amino acid ABC transporter substrate-binding protein [Pseudomonadota bacterium]
MRLAVKCLPIGLLAAVCGCAAQEEVKIGHVAQVTGPSAHLGKSNENGARMAIDDLNAQGFVINGKKVKLVLLAEDDGGDPKMGAAAAQKLVDARVQGVIGHSSSGTTMPASKIYHDAGVPEISPAATTPAYTRQGFANVFRVVANDNKLGATLGHYAVATGHAKRIAVIDDRSAYGQGVADEFVKGAQAANNKVEIISRQYTNDKATDFSAILTQIRAKKPDLVFFGGMDSVGGPMLRQMQALGVDARFMGGDGICTDSLPKLAGPSLGEGKVICAEAGGVSGAQEKAMADFGARYKLRFNSSEWMYAPYVYDAVMVMAAAMQHANSAEPARYLPELARIKYQGVTGTIMFDERGDIKDGALTLFTFKNGKKTKMEVVR